MKKVSLVILVALMLSGIVGKAQNIITKEFVGDWQIIFHSEDACDLSLKVTIDQNQKIQISNKGLGKNTLGDWCKSFSFSNVKLNNNILTFTLKTDEEVKKYSANYIYEKDYKINCFVNEEFPFTLMRKSDYLKVFEK